MDTYTYTVIFEYFKEDETEGYNVVVPAIPEVITWGKTLEEAQANAREALQCHLEGLRKTGETIPADIEVTEVVHVERYPVSI